MLFTSYDEIEYEATEYSVAIAKYDEKIIEITVVQIVVKKFINKDSQEDKYSASMIGKKVIILDQYMNKAYPTIYPYFVEGADGVLTIQGVRLNLDFRGSNENDFQVILHNKIKSRNRFEGALTIQAASFHKRDRRFLSEDG